VAIEPSFRALGPGDLKALDGLLTDNDLPQIVRHFNPFPMSSATAQFIACGEHKDRYFGAFVDGRLVGLAMLRGWDDGYIVPSFGIVVDHRFHGCGIGSQLTDFAISEAVRLGCSQVRLSVYASNVQAYRIYVARGFHEISRESVHCFPEPEEKIVMIKDLVEPASGTVYLG
jgi:ribosomal protein S18 acetylase RimI-like enzyme